MSMFGIGAHKAHRRKSLSPSTRRRNSTRIPGNTGNTTSRDKPQTELEESPLQRHQSCYSPRTSNRSYNVTSASSINATDVSSTIPADENPSLPTNSSTPPRATLSSTSNVRPPSLHHRSPHLQQRYHQTLIQSNSITESTR